MACLIPNSLSVCCTSSIDFQGPTCPGRLPSLGPASLQNRVIQSIRVTTLNPEYHTGAAGGQGTW